MSIWKRARRGLAKVGRKVKRRYFKGRGYSRPKVGTMVKDLKMLKSMVNAEKKRVDVVSYGLTVSQVAQNSNGYLATDITPYPVSSVNYNGRTGSSIKLHSSFMNFQFIQQTNAQGTMKGHMYIIKPTQTQSSIPTFIQNILEPNSFIYNSNTAVIYDDNSQFNPDYFRQYKIIRKRRIYFKSDQLTNQQVVKSVSIPMKYKNHHVRFDGNTTTLFTGQLILLIVLDGGNSSSSTSTLTNIPVSQALTGYTCDYNIKHYYYDN